MRNSRDVSFDTLLHNNGAKDEEDDEVLSEETSSTESEVQSSDSAEETPDNSSSESETVLTKNGDVSSKNEDEISVRSMDTRPEKSSESLYTDSEERSLKDRETKGQSRVTDDTTKKKISNEKRLGASEEKKKSILAHKNAIKDALKDLDSGVQSRDGKKHIVFGDDDGDSDGGTVNTKAAYSLGERVGIFLFTDCMYVQSAYSYYGHSGLFFK